MKLPPLLLVASTLILLTACGTDQDDSHGASRAARYHEDATRNHEEGDRPPRIGMTKDQVIDLYGQPVEMNSTSHGEVWSYVFNNFDARSFIPYYGDYHDATKRRHSGTIIFGADGRVKDFSWNETNPKGAGIWR